MEKDSLKAYESKLEDIYSYFEKAYKQRINDNTLKPLDNLEEYYNTLNHALMALLQKITNKVLWLFAIGQLGWSILSGIISSWLVFYYTDAEGVLYKYIILKW